MVDLVEAAAVDLSALPPATLAGIEIVVGGWGCTPLDDALLARMPKLQLLAYAAGSVKHTVTPATWDHGVVVSSAAAANAVPVAEFTFAAIVMIAKDVFRTRDRHRETRGREAGNGVGPTGELGTRGVRVGVILMTVYTISGLMAGLGGIVLASQLKSSAPTYGQSYELYVIAAVVVGGTSLSGGEGKILGTLIGALIIAVIQNGMNLTGVESYRQKVVLGLVILVAVLLDRLKKRSWKLPRWLRRVDSIKPIKESDASIS
jgi:ABC-type xylose transport system permease subunit